MVDIIDAQLLTIEVSDGEESPSLIEIGQVVSFSGLDGEAPDIDVSHFGTEFYKEFLIGLPVSGPFNMNLISDLTDAGQVELAAMCKTRATREFTITFPSGHTIEFEAYVKSISGGRGSIDSRIDTVCNMMLDGDYVFTPPA
jgi:hypothetical protein